MRRTAAFRRPGKLQLPPRLHRHAVNFSRAIACGLG